MKAIMPGNISYMSMTDSDFTKDLRDINPISINQATMDQFQGFLDKWDYWLDEETKRLSGIDWAWLAPLVEDCRKESVVPTKKHDPAIALTMPEKLIKVTITAGKFGVPWGCAYIRMKEEGMVDY